MRSLSLHLLAVLFPLAGAALLDADAAPRADGERSPRSTVECRCAVPAQSARLEPARPADDLSPPRILRHWDVASPGRSLILAADARILLAIRGPRRSLLPPRDDASTSAYDATAPPGAALA